MDGGTTTGDMAAIDLHLVGIDNTAKLTTKSVITTPALSLAADTWNITGLNHR